MGDDSPDALASRVKTLERQVDELFDKLNPALVSLGRLDERLGALLKALEKVQTAIDSLTAKPARRWDSIINGGLNTGIAALVGWLAAHIK